MSLHELVGKECVVEYDDPQRAAINRLSTWVKVLDVDMPMIKIVTYHGGEATWFHVNKFQTIRARNV